MNNWTAPQKPNGYAEQTLVQAILDGTFPPGSTLPGERTLAEQLGITRPTLREAIQRLSRDGWLTVQQGKSTVVNNYWQDGGLNVLEALVAYPQYLPRGFITNLLEVRLNLAPAYTRAAVNHAPTAVAAYLADYATLAEDTAVFAAYDWQLHRHLAIQSGNAIYTLILNGFTGFYEQLAQVYFTSAEARDRSRVFYADLLEAAQQADADRAEALTHATMAESIQLWQAARAQSQE
ncbi:MAG: fatty acid metabolism transcriptional regulator FadR [Ardenticatenaceae bacterium]|nr:fatty acid metabolism transcriptional regulator FadR [Ardenticatenaceae bacterium]MCB8988930.1 fatty acid metabolism transcriptional regulator FadR [Ardenticatenaceae bacterium]